MLGASARRTAPFIRTSRGRPGPSSGRALTVQHTAPLDSPQARAWDDSRFPLQASARSDSDFPHSRPGPEVTRTFPVHTPPPCTADALGRTTAHNGARPWRLYGSGCRLPGLMVQAAAFRPCCSGRRLPGFMAQAAAFAAAQGCGQSSPARPGGDFPAVLLATVVLVTAVFTAVVLATVVLAAVASRLSNPATGAEPGRIRRSGAVAWLLAGAASAHSARPAPSPP